MRNAILLTLVATVLLTTSASVFGALWEGSGTPEDPYLISTSGQMYYFTELYSIEYPMSHFKLTNDLDLSGFSFMSVSNFRSGFDGDHYTLYNLSTHGLFRSILGSGVVRNLNLVNVELSSNSSKVGALAGVNSGKGGYPLDASGYYM